LNTEIIFAVRHSLLKIVLYKAYILILEGCFFLCFYVNTFACCGAKHLVHLELPELYAVSIVLQVLVLAIASSKVTAVLAQEVAELY